MNAFLERLGKSNSRTSEAYKPTEVAYTNEMSVSSFQQCQVKTSQILTSGVKFGLVF